MIVFINDRKPDSTRFPEKLYLAIRNRAITRRELSRKIENSLSGMLGEDRLDVGFICAPSISLVAIKNRRCHDDSKIKTKCIFFVATFLIPERTWETLKAIFQIVENRDRCRKCWFVFYGRPRYDRNARHGVATACARKFWNVRKEYCIFFIACIGLKYPRYFKILVRTETILFVCSIFSESHAHSPQNW